MGDIVQPLGRVIPIPKGDFVLGTEYKKFDVVRDTVKNAVYVAKKDNKDVALTDETNWMLFVKGVGDGSGGSDNNYTDADKAKVTALPEANPGTAGGLALYDALKTHLDNTANPHKVTAAQVGVSNPNLLMNGDFSVNQRGLESTTAAHDYWLDRWAFYQSNNHAIITTTRCMSDTSYYIHQAVTSVSAEDCAFAFLQFIEDLPSGISPLAGKTVTFSMNASGTQDFRMLEINYTKSDSTGAAFTTEIHPDLNDKTYSLTATLPTNVRRVYACISCSRYVTSADVGKYINFYKPKLEIGSVPTPYVPRPYAEELVLCQRYYRNISDGIEIRTQCIGGTADIYFSLMFPIEMHTVPTLSSGAESTNWRVSDLGYNQVTGFSLSLSTTTPKNVLFRANKINHGMTDAVLQFINSGIGLDAEIY